MIIMCAIVMPSRLRRIPSQRSDPCDCLLKIIHGTMFRHSVPVAGGGCYLEKNIDSFREKNTSCCLLFLVREKNTEGWMHNRVHIFLLLFSGPHCFFVKRLVERK